MQLLNKSCTNILFRFSAANAFAGACEYIIKRRTGRTVRISRLFIYYNGQMIDQRSLDVTDDGASKQSTILGMRKFGICDEHLWPYKEENLNQEPPPQVYQVASKFTVIPLKIPRNIVAMKTCLANQVPFLIGIRLVESATREASDNHGFIRKPDPHDRRLLSIGTHAVLIVGYDDSTQHFIARNSWGRDWVNIEIISRTLRDRKFSFFFSFIKGVDGYFYIPYDYLTEKILVNFMDGIWAIKDIIRRSDHKPTVRRLFIQGHNFDAQRKQMKQLQQMMMTMHTATTASQAHLPMSYIMPTRSMGYFT